MVLGCLAIAGTASGQLASTETVDDRRLPTGRIIAPAGDLLTIPGRPVDLRSSPDGRYVFVKDNNHLRIVDSESFQIIESLPSPGGASLWGLAVLRNGDVLFTNAAAELHIFSRAEPTNVVVEDSESPPAKARLALYQRKTSIALPKDSFPLGIAVSQDEKTAYLCLSKKNQIAEVDLEKATVRRFLDVGVAPFDVCLTSDGSELWVSNLGGRRATAQDRTAPSAGTPVTVDERGIANQGTLSCLARDSGNCLKEVAVGLHPSALTVHADGRLIVCNTNEDSISLVDPKSGAVETRIVKPDERLPFGSMPSALAWNPESSQLLVALAGNNAIGVYPFDATPGSSDRASWRLDGLIPTAWYPTAMAVTPEYLFVCSTKGLGSREPVRPEAKGRNSHDHQGAIQRIPWDQIRQPEQFANWTDKARGLAQIPEIISARTRATSEGLGGVPATPVPKRLGAPSAIRHIIYVIKENRTFDQIFGDIAEARSEPKLCTFPESHTPNHHALARRFGILDNYYCNGVLSADGHSWATEGNVTPYLERAFGGFARSYTFGDDPLTYSSSGFLWDHVLAAGLSFRNYGEMDYATPPDGMDFPKIWAKYTAGESIEFEQNIGIDRLRRYSCRDYPGWNMQIPDVLRVDRFLREFRELEKSGGLPNLCIVYLPQDHLGGSVTSRAHMADNDLAIGRLVEAVSRSRFWKESLIVINEDDPQGGFDHIDGHRSICLVISPYSRSGVNHHFYNQASVLRTILHILGLPPMNQHDAAAPLMAECFQVTPDLRPYKALAASFPLDERPPPPEKQSRLERHWRSRVARVPLHRTGLKTPQHEDDLNRFIWHESRGWETPYPAEWAGAHGRGLARLGLAHAPSGVAGNGRVTADVAP